MVGSESTNILVINLKKERTLSCKTPFCWIGSGGLPTLPWKGCSKLYLVVDFMVTQMVKNLPAMRGTWVQFLCLEDHLEKGMAIHSSVLAWRSPWTKELGRLQSMGSQRIGHN